MTGAEKWLRNLGALGVMLAASLVQAQPTVLDGRIVTRTGLTLYVFGNDVIGSEKSACYPPCSNLHPPYLVEEGAGAAGEYSMLERSDGTRQWMHKGRPLYRWMYDEKPGDVGSDGMNRGLWQIARP